VERSVFELLQMQLSEYKSEISDYLASGYAKNMEEYNRMVGKVELINRLSDDVEQLEKRYIAS
jgi:secreted trypsin-like serine protease